MKTFTQMYGNTITAQELKYNNVQLTTDDDGDVVYRTMGTPEGQPMLQDEEMNPFATPDVPGERETPAEFAETIASGTAGALGGAAAVTVGLPVDLAGALAGIVTGLSAEEGEKLATGLETWANFSEFAGSEAALNGLDSLIENAPLSDEQKQDIRDGSKFLGEWAELPGGVAAIRAGTKAIAEGLRRAKRGESLDKPIQIEIKDSANMPAEPAE